MADFTFEITERVGVLDVQGKGWTVELNKVSWNGRAPKYDIRPWNEDHTQCGKGITLSDEAIKILAFVLKEG